MSKGLQFIILWLSVASLVIIATVHNKINKNFQKFLVISFSVFFSFLYGFRTLGLDLVNYQAYWDSSSILFIKNQLTMQGLFTGLYEPLFNCLIYVCKVYGLEFNQFLFIAVIIPSLILAIFINRKAEKPFVAYTIFMLLFMFLFDLTRLFIALPFILIGFYSDKKIIKIACYLVAFGFHYSSIAIPIFEFAAKIKWNRRKLFYLFALAVVLGAVFRIMSIGFSDYSNYKILYKLQYYLFVAGKKVNSNPNVLMRIMLYIINIYPMFMCYKLLQEKKLQGRHCEKYEKIFNLVKMGIVADLVIVIVFGSIAMGFRILLLTYIALCIPLTNRVASSMYDAKISIVSLRILGWILLYDVFTAGYYLLTAYYY